MVSCRGLLLLILRGTREEEDIYKDKQCSENVIDRIKAIQKEMQTINYKNRGHENAEREEKITQRVFDQQAKTKLVIDFYVMNMQHL